jgi:hypothetical protein
MAHFTLNERVRLSIEIALAARIDDPGLHRLQYEEAKRLGMSGAEIDAARRGRSFDAQISIALALATAPDAAQRQTQRQRARKAGIADDVSDRIEQLAAALREARSNG